MKISAGILMYRVVNGEMQVFLAHPGGPFYKNKDDGYWSVPKGEVKQGEDLKETAVREFKEETGIDVDVDKLRDLGDITQKSGKRVFAWAYEFDFRGKIKSNMVWHPVYDKFPEVDKGEYFNIDDAKKKILASQFEFIERLSIIRKQK